MVCKCVIWKEFFWKVFEDSGEKNGIVRECDKLCGKEDFYWLFFRC